MLDCGFSPLMSSLSDRNMRLGDVLLPPGIKQRCLYLRVQGLFTLRKVLLMQLFVALSLHFGWDSQLNTSLALLSSFGREISLVKITGPQSIFTSLFTPTIYFQLLLSLVSLLSLALTLCERQGRTN